MRTRESQTDILFVECSSVANLGGTRRHRRIGVIVDAIDDDHNSVVVVGAGSFTGVVVDIMTVTRTSVRERRRIRSEEALCDVSSGKAKSDDDGECREAKKNADDDVC